MKHSHIPETKLIDWLSGTLPEREKEEVSHHLTYCETCRSLLETWKGIGIGAEAQYRQPPSLLKERIWADVEIRKQMKRVRLGFRWATGLAALAIAAFVFAARTFSPDDGQHMPPNEHDHYMIVQTSRDIPVQRIVHNPDTKQFPIEPLSNFETVRGTIWLNDANEEMLMEIDGMQTFATRDYQLWIIYTNNEVKGELLAIERGSSRIWIKGKDVKQFKQIKASLEPKGGSLTPTGPETFIVNLERQ